MKPVWTSPAEIAHALSFSYEEWSEPVVSTHTNLSGKKYTITKRGALKAEWESPHGRLVLMTAVSEEPSGELIEAWRPALAQGMYDAYASGLREKS